MLVHTHCSWYKMEKKSYQLLIGYPYESTQLPIVARGYHFDHDLSDCWYTSHRSHLVAESSQHLKLLMDCVGRRFSYRWCSLGLRNARRSQLKLNLVLLQQPSFSALGRQTSRPCSYSEECTKLAVLLPTRTLRTAKPENRRRNL